MEKINAVLLGTLILLLMLLSSVSAESTVLMSTENSTTITETTTPAATFCGSDYTAIKGEILSPNWPGNYPTNVDCNATITIPGASFINLKANSFNLEQNDGDCESDYLEYKVMTLTKASKLCSNLTINITGDFVYLHFVSDNSGTGLGFNISYEAFFPTTTMSSSSSMVEIIASNPTLKTTNIPTFSGTISIAQTTKKITSLDIHVTSANGYESPTSTDSFSTTSTVSKSQKTFPSTFSSTNAAVSSPNFSQSQPTPATSLSSSTTTQPPKANTSLAQYGLSTQQELATSPYDQDLTTSTDSITGKSPDKEQQTDDDIFTGWKLIVIIVVPGAVVLFLLIVTTVVCIRRKKKQSEGEVNSYELNMSQIEYSWKEE